MDSINIIELYRNEKFVKSKLCISGRIYCRVPWTILKCQIFYTISGLPLRDTDLQCIDFIGSLRAISVLLCHPRTAETVWPRFEVFHHQIGDFLVILARCPTSPSGNDRLHFANLRRCWQKSWCRGRCDFCWIPKFSHLHWNVLCCHRTQVQL